MSNKAFVSQKKEWRHYLHACLEYAFGEVKTSEYVTNILEGKGLKVRKGTIRSLSEDSGA